VSFNKKSGCDFIKETLPVTMLRVSLAQASVSSSAIVCGSLALADICETECDASVATAIFFVA
jgi:hypothetical protein